MSQIRIIINTDDIKDFYGVNRFTAGRKITEVKKSIGKKKKEAITVHEFAAFHNIDFEVLLNAINSKSVAEYVKKTKETKDKGIENSCSDIPTFKIATCNQTPIIK